MVGCSSDLEIASLEPRREQTDGADAERRDDKRNETGTEDDPVEEVVAEEEETEPEFDEDFDEIDSELDEVGEGGEQKLGE